VLNASAWRTAMRRCEVLREAACSNTLMSNTCALRITHAQPQSHEACFCWHCDVDLCFSLRCQLYFAALLRMPCCALQARLRSSFANVVLYTAQQRPPGAEKLSGGDTDTHGLLAPYDSRCRTHLPQFPVPLPPFFEAGFKEAPFAAKHRI
jgi:hypothetical protein